MVSMKRYICFYVSENFWGLIFGKKLPKPSYRAIGWFWRSVDWSMFPNIIIVSNFQETFILWLHDKHN